MSKVDIYLKKIDKYRMMLEPSSFLNSSIVGFFSLDFSHGLNDNPHKKNHSPTCFTLTLTAL